MKNKRKKDQQTQKLNLPILFTLALLAAVAPFATDLYLSAFPQIVLGLNTDVASVQLTLTAFLIGAGLGQLIFGPLSDRYGRYLPLTIGTGLCVVASAGTALAPNIEALIVMRFIQGVAGSAGMVIGRAIVADLAESNEQATKAFSLMMTIVGIAPIVAPWLGSLLVKPIGWRGTLWVVFGITVIMLVAVLIFIRESHISNEDESSKRIEREHIKMFSFNFWGYTFCFGLAFAVMMAYISFSPFLFQSIIGMSVEQYGMMFAAIAIVLTIAGVTSARLVDIISPARQLFNGLLVLTISSVVLLWIVVSQLSAIWMIFPIIVAIGSLGFVFGNATSFAIASSATKGTGSAVLGAMQFGLGALVAPIVGLSGDRNVTPMVIVMVISSSLSLVSYLVIKKYNLNCRALGRLEKANELNADLLLKGEINETY